MSAVYNQIFCNVNVWVDQPNAERVKWINNAE